VINAARSPQAVISVYSKFGVNVKYSKIQLFKTAVEKFVKERPREWLALLGLRATRVEQDLGFVEYVVVLQVSPLLGSVTPTSIASFTVYKLKRLHEQHRESWQNIGSILSSKAEVTSFTLELAKQLGMRYSAPPLPVTLQMHQDSDQNISQGEQGTHASEDLRALFQQAGAVEASDIGTES